MKFFVIIMVSAYVLGNVVVAAEAQAPERFVISNFDEPETDLKKWSGGDSGAVKITAEPMTQTDPNTMLKVVFKSGSWPGISTVPPKNWSPYECLRFVVWTKSAFSLSIRIDDPHSTGYATRYNRTFKLSPGRNLCQIEVRDISRVLDVTQIKALILFTSHPPAGLTMYFDDIILGDLLSEKVPFIPYGKRKDLQPTLDVVTPHLPMAKNLAGGPLRAFVLSDIAWGREVPEMMQRMDMDVSVMTWDRNWDTNTWGMGDFYGQRGHAFDYTLMQKYLASSMQGPEKFDVLVMSTPQGWERFPKGAREAILKRVRDDGDGLVLVFPWPGKQRRQPWPDDLKALSALIDSDTDYPNPSGYIHAANSGRIRGQSWTVTADHPITRGVPLDAIPMTRITIQKYEPAPGADVLIATENGAPVLAVKTFGKGRVATFAWRTRALTPAVRDGAQLAGQLPYRYWEPIYSLMDRAAYWAAGRTFLRDGEPEELRPVGDDADPNLTVKQWKNADGKVTDWEMSFTPPGSTGVASITLAVPKQVNRGDAITGTFSLVYPKPKPAETPGDATPVEPDIGDIRVTFSERVGGRRRTLESNASPADFSTISLKHTGDDPEPQDGMMRRNYTFTIPTDRVRQLLGIVEVTVTKAGVLTAEGTVEVIVTPRYSPGERRWKKYEILMWPVDGLPFLQRYEDLMMIRFGATGVMETRWNRESRRMRWARAGLRIMPHSIVNRNLHLRNFPIDQWSKTHDRKYLIRKPSYADDDFLAEQKKFIQNAVRTLMPFNPTNYVLSDEPSLTSYTADFDFDFHPANIAKFRDALREKFQTPANLQNALGITVPSFDAITPPTTAEARKSGNWSLWNEWRAHNDAIMAAGYKMYRDAIREVDPNGTISISGTQTATPFDGYDWGRLAPLFNTMQGYGYGYQDQKRLSFNPAMINATPAGYGRKGRAVDAQVWTKLCEQGGGHVLFWWIAFRNPDLSFCQSAKDYQRVFSEMKSGIALQFMQANRMQSPVAILYSMNSLRAAYADGKMEGRGGAYHAASDKVTAALMRAGYDPVFVTDEQVAAGILGKQGFKAIFLPYTVSLGYGDKPGGLAVKPALEAFIQTGGLVVATDTFKYDEFLRLRKPAGVLTDKVLKFDAVNASLQKILSGIGASPAVTVFGENGTPLSKLTAYTHRINGGSNAFLITLVRQPAGTKEVLGADGVVMTVPDPNAGREIEPVTVDVSRFSGMRFFDIRGGKVMTPVDGKLSFGMRAGDGFPIAVLPYTIRDINVTAAIQDRALTIQWRLTSDADTLAAHVVRIKTARHTLSGKNNDALPDAALTVNSVTGANGEGTVTFPLAVEDRGSDFIVRVRDVMTGVEKTVTVRYAPDK